MADIENVVAEWRAAMEGVTDGPYFINPKDGQEVLLDYGKQEAFAYLRKTSDVAWIARCSPSSISGLLALIETQRATIERVEQERDDLQERFDQLHAAKDIHAEKRHEAEARVTALEEEKAGAVKLADGYGIVLMMIAAGCSQPQRFAKRMLAEYASEAKKVEATK